MYICICNNFNEKTLNDAIKSQAKSVRGVFKYVQAKPQCGKCIPEIKKALDNSQKQNKNK